MHDRPLPVLPNPYGYRVHHAAAIGCAIAGFDVQVPAAKTIRAMVAMLRPRAAADHLPAAALALEQVAAAG